MKYSIKKTADLGFDPTELDIVVGNKIEKEVEEKKVAFIQVTAILTHKTTNSITQRKTDLEFPYEVWRGIVTGYDVDAKEPILNTTKLGGLLKSFNLQLA